MSDTYRDGLVQMLNVLGAPRPCPGPHCEGCAYEREEAILTGLTALGYIKRNEFIETGRTEGTNTAGGPMVQVEGHWEIEPEPLDAWEGFMRMEFGVELPAGWKDKPLIGDEGRSE